MRSENPPFAYRNHIAPGLDRDVAFYVPASAYEKYNSVLGPYNPVYTIVESIESASLTLDSSHASAVLSFLPAHEAVNPEFVITPADDGSGTVAEVRVAEVTPGQLILDINAIGSGTATFHIGPAHRSDDYAVLTVKAPQTTGIGQPENDAECLWPADIYSSAGLLLRRGASEPDLRLLPRGVYILRTPAGVRKLIR